MAAVGGAVAEASKQHPRMLEGKGTRGGGLSRGQAEPRCIVSSIPRQPS